MIEEKAYVVAKYGAYAWVEASRRSSCDGCTMHKGCGTGAIAHYLRRSPARIRASNLAGADIGDEVIVGIPEKALVQGAIVIYMLPLLTLFLGMGLGELWGRYLWASGESLSIGLGFLGLTAGFSGGRYITSRLSARRCLEPRILRLVSKQQPLDALSRL